MHSYTKYQEAQRNMRETEEWFKHFTTNDWQTKTPGELSPAHSIVKLIIPNQYSAGGKNYHESPAAFNSALLTVLATTAEGKALLQQARHLVAAKERKALIACETELKSTLEAVQAAKEA